VIGFATLSLCTEACASLGRLATLAARSARLPDAAVTRASIEKRQRVDHNFAAEIRTAPAPLVTRWGRAAAGSSVGRMC
jgi:hypothetical protein